MNGILHCLYRQKDVLQSRADHYELQVKITRERLNIINRKIKKIITK